jgi:hypothetical protein
MGHGAPVFMGQIESRGEEVLKGDIGIFFPLPIPFFTPSGQNGECTL